MAATGWHSAAAAVAAATADSRPPSACRRHRRGDPEVWGGEQAQVGSWLYGAARFIAGEVSANRVAGEGGAGLTRTQTLPLCTLLLSARALYLCVLTLERCVIVFLVLLDEGRVRMLVVGTRHQEVLSAPLCLRT